MCFFAIIVRVIRYFKLFCFCYMLGLFVTGVYFLFIDKVRLQVRLYSCFPRFGHQNVLIFDNLAVG